MKAIDGLSSETIVQLFYKHNTVDYRLLWDNTQSDYKDHELNAVTWKNLYCKDIPEGYPKIVENPQLKAVQKYHTAVFACRATAEGQVQPTIYWLKDFKPVDTNDPRIKMFEDGMLIIERSQEQDIGRYECVAENEIGVAYSFAAMLYVKTRRVPPFFPFPPRDVEVETGSETNITCAAKGVPMPLVFWQEGGRNLSMNPGMIPIGFNTLRLKDVQESKNYTCVATSILGNITSDVQVKVKGYKPEIKILLREVKVAEGHSVVLPCETVGNPYPVIYWKRGHMKLVGQRYIIHRTGNLSIDNARIEDGGTYTCFAENRYGKASATGDLIVRLRTIIRSGPHPDTQKLRQGSKLHFTCYATTDYKEISHLTIAWLKNGKQLNMEDPRISNDNGKGLIITDVKSEDTGNYTCVASNGLDYDSMSAEVNVVAPPDPPSDVSIKSCTARGALVTWTPGKDNFSPIIKYHVEFNHSYAPTEWEKIAAISNPEVTETSVVLSPYANYTFRVIAENELGRSKPSDTSKAVCRARPETPAMHPQNVRTDGSKPGVLIVKWDQMKEIDHNADNFKYVLVIKEGEMTTSYEISDWTVTQKEIDYGLVYTPFKFYVEAQNALGACSRPVTIMTGYTGEDKPIVIVQNFEVLNTTGKWIEANSAWFQWDPVETSPDRMKGEFYGYKIRFWKVNDPVNTRKEIEIPRKPAANSGISRAGKDMAKVEGLYPFSHMQADIVARNTYYQSKGSDVINFTTPVQAGAPKITYAPNNMSVAKGLNASFTCKASGYPQPSFHWEKKGKQLITKGSLRYEVLSIPHGSVLRIEAVKKRKDSHTFTCVATNEYGEARAKAELSVFQRKDFGSCRKGSATWKDCKLLSERIPIPKKRRLLTVQEFRDNVIDKTLYSFYGGIAKVAEGLLLEKAEWRFFFSDSETNVTFKVKANAADGSCIYETNRDYFCSDSLRFDASRRMLINNKDYVMAFFSSKPEQYVWLYICVCEGANSPMTTGACPTSNVILLLITPTNGPDNINLERAALDMRELTCLTMEGLPGEYTFFFQQGSSECPDRPE